LKLIIHTPEGGDWTVVQDENGKTIYEGHRSWDDLTSAVLGYANPLCDLQFVEYSDEEFEEMFV
jgi:hypothetical protein